MKLVPGVPEIQLMFNQSYERIRRCMILNNKPFLLCTVNVILGKLTVWISEIFVDPLSPRQLKPFQLVQNIIILK